MFPWELEVHWSLDRTSAEGFGSVWPRFNIRPNFGIIRFRFSTQVCSLYCLRPECVLQELAFFVAPKFKFYARGAPKFGLDRTSTEYLAEGFCSILNYEGTGSFKLQYSSKVPTSKEAGCPMSIVQCPMSLLCVDFSKSLQSSLSHSAQQSALKAVQTQHSAAPAPAHCTVAHCTLQR